MKRKIFNNIYLYKPDSKNKKDLSELYFIIEQFYESFLKSLYPGEVYNYLNYFLSEDAIKDKIEFDKNNYYVINFKDKAEGFFNFKIFDNSLFLSEIFVSDKHRNKGVARFVLNFLIEKAKEENIKTIQTSIYKNNTVARTIFNKLGFKQTETIAKYLGSDIYIFEDKFEYLLN